MINLNPNIGQATAGNLQQALKPQGETGQTGEFSKTVNAIEKYLSSVDQDQQSSNMSIQDLLSGRNDDIASVVAAVAKADISFKVLVGVRNKLIDAYKQTMSMSM
jgi:flagellar hook-basal body complex protein FliE